MAVSETLKNDLESRYADYLLLDRFGAPIAIIEAKRASRDPILTAQKQAQEYANDIRDQTGKDVFIFMSNGYEIWFWDRESYGPRLVKGFFSQSDLERLRFQDLTREDLSEFEIDHNFRKRYAANHTDRKGRCFFIPISEIKENGYDLSISKYKEIEYEDVVYEKPEVIMGKIEGLEDQIKTDIAELKDMLKQA